MATYHEPYLDAAGGPPLDAAPPPEVDPFEDLRAASQNYWAGRTGRERPPAPTFRQVGGRKLLGRYMDPYGCQCHMRARRQLWEKWYTGFFVSCGVTLIFAEVDWVMIFLFIPAHAIWYFSVKAKHRRQYDQYYAIQEEILQTGEPQWVPYDKERLKLLDRNPMAVWP